jgi:hypothetical protein
MATAGNVYVVETDVGVFDTVKRIVVGKDKHELQKQVMDLKRQRDELTEAGKQAVAGMRALAQTLQAQIDQTSNPR